MSAFIHDHGHIDALVWGAINLQTGLQGDVLTVRFQNGVPPLGVTNANATQVGQALVNENRKSVNYRYNEDIEPEEYRYEHRYRLGEPWTPEEILLACSSYDYQACEHPDYEKSPAHDIIEAIRGRAIRALPGYKAANTWSIARPQPQEATS